MTGHNLQCGLMELFLKSLISRSFGLEKFSDTHPPCPLWIRGVNPAKGCSRRLQAASNLAIYIVGAIRQLLQSFRLRSNDASEVEQSNCAGIHYCCAKKVARADFRCTVSAICDVHLFRFFSSGLADVALWLGPNMSISS